MFDLTGKVAIVTGGSRGIGRATAETLASRGAHVVLTYVKNEAEARAAVAAIEAKGGKAEAVAFDVGDPKATEDAIAAVAKRLGRLDILVSNAGVALDGLLLRLKDEDLSRQLDVNLRGALAAARAAIKVMMRARGGRVVFMSSVIGEMGNAGQVGYAATKAALLGVTKTLAREYASRGITVNAVTPGFVETDMTASISGEAREAMLKAVPLGRTAKSEEIAAAVLYLCSDEAAYVTGHALRVNGGMYM